MRIISNKDRRINIRVTEKEYQKIKMKAQKARLNMSRYVSLSAVDKDVVVFDELIEFIGELAKEGNKLNHLTMLAHQGRITSIDLSSAKKVVADILLLLKKENVREYEKF